MLSPLINQMLSASTVFHIPSHQLIFSESEPSKTTSLLHKRGSCDPLSVELLEDTSLDCTDPPSAPVLSCKMSSHQEVVELSIPIDVVGVFHLDTLLSSVATALKSAITTQLRTIGEETFWKVRIFFYQSSPNPGWYSDDAPTKLEGCLSVESACCVTKYPLP